MEGACGALNFGDERCLLRRGVSPAHPPHKLDQRGPPRGERGRLTAVTQVFYKTCVTVKKRGHTNETTDHEREPLAED